MIRLIASTFLVLSLAGCAPGIGSYPEATASELQQKVLEVTTTSTAADFPASLVHLDELEAMADEALARGRLTEARRTAIQSAIELVRTDLEAAIADREEEQREKDEEDDRGDCRDSPGKRDRDC